MPVDSCHESLRRRLFCLSGASSYDSDRAWSRSGPCCRSLRGAIFGRLALLLIVLPFIEMTLLLVLVDVTSSEDHAGVLVVTWLLGAWLLKSQGLRTAQRISRGAGRERAGMRFGMQECCWPRVCCC